MIARQHQQHRVPVGAGPWHVQQTPGPPDGTGRPGTAAPGSGEGWPGGGGNGFVRVGDTVTAGGLRCGGNRWGRRSREPADGPPTGRRRRPPYPDGIPPTRGERDPAEQGRGWALGADGARSEPQGADAGSRWSMKVPVARLTMRSSPSRTAASA